MANHLPQSMLQSLLGGLDMSAPTVKVSLHTANPRPTIDPTEPTRLFLVDADGERHECEPVGPGTFGTPDGSFIARRWEIWSERTGSVLKGTFDPPEAIE